MPRIESFIYPYYLAPEMEEDHLLTSRKEKFEVLFKKKNGVLVIILALFAYFAFWIRTRNLSGLRDATTGGWTLGPDLDPFLFLRWAKDIVANGSLMAVDPLRYVPLSYPTTGELPGIPYLIAWFHNFTSPWWTSTVEHSAVIFPAFMFALTTVAFFLLVRLIFINNQGDRKATLIATIATFFLIIIPSLLPRTVAGIPEKESVGFFLLFLVFYAFIKAWRSQTRESAWIWAFVAGAITAAMNLTWGGAAYILFTIAVTSFLGFLLGQMNHVRAGSLAIWYVSAMVLAFPFTTRFGATFFDSLRNFGLATSQLITLTTLVSYVILFLISRETPLKRLVDKVKFTRKLPKPVTALIIVAFIGLVIALILFGPSFITSKIFEIKNNLINPITDRLGVTVAENRQPFFAEWANSFGPVVQGVPILFWLFFVGSIVLFYNFSKTFGRKDQHILTFAYIIFLVSIIFSRYNPNGILNGTNTISLLLYMGGFVALLLAAGYVYYHLHRREELSRLHQLDVGLLLLLVLFFLCIASARGAVRLIMMLVPPAAILVAYLVVTTFSGVRRSQDDLIRSIGWILVVVVLGATLFAGVKFYQETKSAAQSYVPSVYTNQWQKAMAWVRESTPENAVFAHWWDYGYWVQSIGNRATILDGGNVIPYWNHLVGRHILTGRDKQTALEFLYTHKATHLLIDSTDIGKYGAFSSIGSDENYDRRSWIPTLSRARIDEAKNKTIIYYQGGFAIDQDIIYRNESETIELPEGKAALGAVIIEETRNETLFGQPQGIYIFQKNRNTAQEQYTLPLRYAYHNNVFYDYKSGVEAGIFTLPAVTQQGSIERSAGLLYLSNKTVQSHLARLYLYKENDPNFVLVHSEDDYIVQQLKNANLLSSQEDFVIYQGLRGPIRIWEINYPQGIKENNSYLSKEYPEILRRA